MTTPTPTPLTSEGITGAPRTVTVTKILYTKARCRALVNVKRGWQCKATATRMVMGETLPDGMTQATWFCDEHIDPWLAGDIDEKVGRYP